ncbi:MAG: metabolite traffic protein EboE [Verrucomicrobiota bacterium]
MELKNGVHLGYCTNIHRGEDWEETFAGLRDYTLRVKERVCPTGERYGIGLRLSAQAAQELWEEEAMSAFRRWLDDNDCYVFTINGFPYGKFHGTRVKEQVYAPDWTSSLRLEYTEQLFQILVRLLDGEDASLGGSVSTLPGSFKEFVTDETQVDAICMTLRLCAETVQRLAEESGRDLHLGLEPEPLGLFETTPETVEFFGRLTEGVSDREAFLKVMGVNYDTCHLGVEYEEAEAALGRLREAGLRVSKLHLSSALRLEPTGEVLELLKGFDEEVYLHQVVVREGDAVVERLRDLPEAFAWAEEKGGAGNLGDEWRVHFHVPLHASPAAPFGDTRDHLEGVLGVMEREPGLCSHVEMETYTWEVLPAGMQEGDVVDQLVKEYEWTLGELRGRGF